MIILAVKCTLLYIFILRYFNVKLLVPAGNYKVELVVGDPNKSTSNIFDNIYMP